MKHLADWEDVKITEVPDGETFTRIGLCLGECNFAAVEVFRSDGTKLCSINVFEFEDGAGDVDVIINNNEQTGKPVLLVDGVPLEMPDTSQVSVFGVDIKRKDRRLIDIELEALDRRRNKS